jgi:hypothetical protein
MDSIQPRSWHRLTLAAVAGVGIALSAILAVHFSNTQIEEKRHQLIVEAMTFTDDLEQYLQGREKSNRHENSNLPCPVRLGDAHHQRSARNQTSFAAFRQAHPRTEYFT